MKIQSDLPYSSTPEFQCDCKTHTDQAHSQLTLWFWYGSKYDMSQGNLHMCDKCAEEVMEYLKKKFDIEGKFLTKIEEF